MLCVWGNKEAPPNWVILRITDASKAQVEHYLEKWRKKFDHEILVNNPQRYRIKVTVSPALVSASGINRSLKPIMKEYIQNLWFATIIFYDAYTVIFDVAKPVDLQNMKEDVLDIFANVVNTRFHYFSDADVDTALANGGYMEMTKAQVLNRIKSKLDE